MNYPEYIYRNLEIVEKDIYGDTHYGVIETKRILGFAFKVQKRVYQNIIYPHYGYFASYGQKWVNNLSCVKDAIKSENNYAEYRFKKKLTK